MNLKDLWIGDLLKIISTNEIGSFEGNIGDRIALVKVKGKKKEALITDLERYEEVEKKKEHKRVYKQPTTFIKKDVPDFIDLHLEKLTSSHLQIIPEIKLDFQVNACISYLQDAIRLKKTKLSIIHGKGTGTLKAEVHNLIQDFPEIYHSHEINDGGGLEVWLKYQ